MSKRTNNKSVFPLSSTAQKKEEFLFNPDILESKMMIILKDIFVFLVSMISLCLCIIFLNYITIPPIINLCISAFIYGVFIAYYFRNLKFIIPLISIFYFSILLMSLDTKVILMFLITLATYFCIKSIVFDLPKATEQDQLTEYAPSPSNK